MNLKIFTLFLSCFVCLIVNAQDDYIYSKEGKTVLNRRIMVYDCLRAMHKDKSDAVATAICYCQADKMDGHFTNKQYRKYTSNGIINMQGLLGEDSILKKELDSCFFKSNKTFLINAESEREKTIDRCVKQIQKNSNKKLDSNRQKEFCSCQLELIKNKEMSDDEFLKINDPNSVFFFEVMYKCGNPFLDTLERTNNWNENAVKDVTGPTMDTVKILTLNGMTYVKLKVGSFVQFWLFDTGASDLLITDDMETELKKEHVVTDSNYLGTGEYEMANGMIDICRKYIINNVRIGRFYLNNILIAVSDKAKRVIVGKGLMNKFKSWTLDNKENTLILNK